MLLLFLISIVTARAAPLQPNAHTATGPHHVQYRTSPTRVNSHGDHISNSLRPYPINSRGKRDIAPSQALKLEQLYVKLPVLEETLFLNLTLSDWANDATLVEYVKQNGSSKIRTPQQAPCDYYTGIVHEGRSEGGRPGLGAVMEGAWSAVSTCNGLFGIVHTKNHQLYIEPSPRTHTHSHQHTITKSTLHPSQVSQPHQHQSTPHCSTTSEPTTTPSSQQGTGSRVRRLAGASDAYIEAVLVADSSVLGYHQQHDTEGGLEAYLFTLMHIVSHLFRDVSIGRFVKIALSRVVILEEPQSFSTMTSGYDMLDGFCSWLHEHEQQQDLGHDVAVLLTRQEICNSDGSNCKSLGMANIGSACEGGSSCNMNRDRGLGTAFTIAHEIGHNLGMRHDGDPTVNCGSDEKFIMAPSFAESANPHIWSECSRQHLEDFLSTPQSSCLYNVPPATAETFTDDSLLFPGTEYTPTEQCRLHLGGHASYCPGNENMCSTMWCRANNDSICTNLLTPLAAGTECVLDTGGMGVCYQSNCVPYTEVATPTDGGWSEWGEWTDCSLECGMGIKHRDRECNSPIPRKGGLYCKGERRQYQTCNQHPCEAGDPEGDIRQQYCDMHPPSNRYSVWKTVSLDRISHLHLDPCESHCYPASATTTNSVIHSFTPVPLPDATPCLTDHTHSQGVCLSGRCKPISCGGVLGVESTRDECGVWCGDGSSCVGVAGTFSQVDTPGEYRYYHVLTIPAGSTHISVHETTPSSANYLALEALRTQDALNRDLTVLPAGTRQLTFAGSTWTYVRLLNGSERISTSGPIDEDVSVYVLAYYEYDGISFSFNIPKMELGMLTQVVYFWNVTEWGSCDATGCGAGAGQQERGVSCRRFVPGEGSVESEDGEEGCGQSLPRPLSSRECGSPCQYRWVVREWDQCNVSCGGMGEGVRRREVRCEVWEGGEEGEVEEGGTVVPDHQCPADSRPEETQPCGQEACHYEWKHGQWESCDAVCGEGWRQRGVWCEQGGGVVSNEALCSTSEKPAVLDVCHAPYLCSEFEWATAEWSECTGSCGETATQSRTTSCVHQNGTQVQSQFCSTHPPPETTRTCTPVCTTPTPLTTPTSLAPPPGCLDRLLASFCQAVHTHNLCSRYKSNCCATCFYS